MEPFPEVHLEGNANGGGYGEKLLLIVLIIFVAFLTFGLLLWNGLRYGELEGLTFMAEASPTRATSPARPKAGTTSPLPAFSATGSKVTITGLQRGGETESVIITNQGGATQDMSGWVLCRAPCEGRFLFPQGFLLEPNVSVPVHSGKGGNKTPAWGFHWTEESKWGIPDGEALLLDAAERLVSRYSY